MKLDYYLRLLSYYLKDYYLLSYYLIIDYNDSSYNQYKKINIMYSFLY